MVERIEVLTDGASSVYGSDAVAGVVNFILRSDYQGAEFSTNYGISDKDDGESQGLPVHVRPDVRQGLDHGRHQLQQDRAGSRRSSRFLEELGVAVRHERTVALRSGLWPAVPAGPHRRFDVLAVRTRPDAGCVPRYLFRAQFLARNPGTTGQNVATDYHCYVNNRHGGGPSDKYNFATVNLILTPQERTGLFLNGNYKLTDNVEVYASVMHNKTSSAFQLAPDPLHARRRPADFGRQLLQPVRRRLSLGRRQLRYASRDARQSPRRVRHEHRSGLDRLQGLVRRVERPAVELGCRHGLRPCQPVRRQTSGLPNLTKLNQATGPSFLGPTDGVVHCGTADAPSSRLHADQHLQSQRSEHDRGAAAASARRRAATSSRRRRSGAAT